MIGKMIARPLGLGGIELWAGRYRTRIGRYRTRIERYRTWSLGAKGRRHLTI